jgi:hypothetical protein
MLKMMPIHSAITLQPLEKVGRILLIRLLRKRFIFVRYKVVVIIVIVIVFVGNDIPSYVHRLDPRFRLPLLHNILREILVLLLLLIQLLLQFNTVSGCCFTLFEPLAIERLDV